MTAPTLANSKSYTNIETVKQIDIVSVIGSYTELIKSGANYRAKENPLREEKTSSFQIYTTTQRYHDFGTHEGGDIIDFIRAVENLSMKEAITFLSDKYLNGMELNSNYTPPARKYPTAPIKDNELLISTIEQKAKTLLANRLPYNKIIREKYSEMILDNDGVESKVIRVAPIFEKLFEGYLIPTEKKFAEYLFNKIIGYDPYFNCPAIIIRDEAERAVNIIRYRPERNGEPLLQNGKPLKYLYLRGEETPDNAYTFPLQAQMQMIVNRERYSFIGEGLKNAINASLMGIPYISTESASNIKPELISFLNSNRMQGVILIGAFDGDGAGEKAYKKINEEVTLFKNKFAFDSDIDFSDWLKELKKC